MKAMVVFGTRPEAIKLAPVVHCLTARGIEHRVCVTAQHRAMLDQVLELFRLQPDRDLDLMRDDQTPASFLALACRELSTTFAEDRPDVVIVQGDSMTSFAGALSGFLAGTRVAHVEAGLRTFDRSAPFPEEGLRCMISQVADFHFAPTVGARNNLLAERIGADRIWVTGNTVVDALGSLAGELALNADAVLAHHGVRKPFVLITNHRRESFGAPLRQIFEALSRLADAHPNLEFVFPVHPNPNVRRASAELLRERANIRLLEPLDYSSFLTLLSEAEFVISDSGGVQEEAPSLGKVVLVTREVTERPELISCGLGRIVGHDPDLIVREAERLIAGEAPKSHPANPFGDGGAADRIVDVLTQGFCTEFSSVTTQTSTA